MASGSDTQDAFLGGGDDTQNAEAPPRFDATVPGAHGYGVMLDRVGAGTVLAERYRLESELGRGGMGSVWRATHLALDSPVAVKFIDPRLAGTDAARARFFQEARAAATLRSPNVVQVMDHGVDGGVPFIVMELLNGEPLSARIKRGPMSAAQLLPIIDDVARALDRAHENGIVHRDLKPDNVFLVRDGDREIAKVLDFGIAKVSDADTGPGEAPTQTGTVLGTPHYMSPEQAEDTKAADARTDLWAMGVIAYEGLMGRRPFEGDTVTRVILKICTADLPVPSRQPDAPAVPSGFDAWFARACARNRDARFDSAGQAARALHDALSGAAVRAIGPASPATRRSRGWVLPAVGASIAVAAGVGWMLMSDNAPASQPAAAAVASAPPPAVPEPSEPEPTKDPAQMMVRLTVDATPPGATVRADARVLGTAPGPFELPRGTDPVTITVELAGHATHTSTVKPDGHHTLTMELEADATDTAGEPEPSPVKKSTTKLKSRGKKRRAERKSKDEPLLEF